MTRFIIGFIGVLLFLCNGVVLRDPRSGSLKLTLKNILYQLILAVLFLGLSGTALACATGIGNICE
jgi:hypothetical protein